MVGGGKDDGSEKRTLVHALSPTWVLWPGKTETGISGRLLPSGRHRV